MEWSFAEKGSGYLYATAPLTNDIVWSFDGIPDCEANQRTINVKEEQEFVVIHESDAAYAVKIAKQTRHYIKVFYKQTAGATTKKEPSEPAIEV